MARPKVTVVGAGNVGATTAQYIVERKLADVVLTDVVDGLPQGKALDLLQAGPVHGYDCRITGANDYEPTAGSDIIVITARPRAEARDEPGRPPHEERRDRGRGRGRDDAAVADRDPHRGDEPARRHGPARAPPVGLPEAPRHRMAGVLDSARFRTFIAQELDVSVENVSAFVLGGHGDTMVPLPRYSTVAGIPITELLSKDRLDALVTRTANGGAEIVGLLKTGSAYYAPAASVVEMVEAILRDKKKVLPCTVTSRGTG